MNSERLQKHVCGAGSTTGCQCSHKYKKSGLLKPGKAQEGCFWNIHKLLIRKYTLRVELHAFRVELTFVRNQFCIVCIFTLYI